METQGRQGMGNICMAAGEEGYITKAKRSAGLQHMNIIMDTLTPCEPGHSELNVESWRLKPANFLLETVVSAPLNFALKW